MKKKWIIINIETKSREFHSKLLLSFLLLNEGYGVIFCNEFESLDYIELLPKGLFINQNILHSKFDFLKTLKNKGIKIYTLDEEGFVFPNKEKYLNRISEKNMKLIDKFLCTGKEQYNIVTQNFLNFKDKISITGNPRFDILNSKLRDIENDVVYKIKKKYNNFLLIVSNFSGVNFFTDKDEKSIGVVDSLKTHNLIKNKKDYLYFDNFFKHSEKVFKEMKRLIIDLSTKYPDKNIVIRPHPSENKSSWKKFARDYNNIKVVYEYDLNSWLKSADLVIQNSCTSAIESLILDVPCISYRPIKNDKYEQPLPNMVSIQANNSEEVFVLIEKFQKNDDFYKEKYFYFKNVLKKYIEFDNLKLNANKIVDLIKEENLKLSNFSIFFIKLKIYKNKIKKYFKLFFMRLFILFFGKQKLLFASINARIKRALWRNEYKKNKIGIINAYEIKKHFDFFNKKFNKNKKINIKKLDKNFFIFH